MGTLTINTRVNVRNRTTFLKDLSLAYGVASQPDENSLINESGVSEPLREIADNPDWSTPPLRGFTHYFPKHNDFRDQELYDRVVRDVFDRKAMAANFYTTTYDPSGDPLWHEDNNRTIDRVFEIRIAMELQPENEIYGKWGIIGLDTLDAHVQISTFLQLNYQSLIEHGLGPSLSTSDHNPILYQRGYTDFNYHGFAASQIFPKAGDLIKLESYDKLYQIESITNADPQYQHRERKYFWKLSMQEFRDDAKTVSDDVKENPLNKNFINDLFGEAGVFDENSFGQDVEGSQLDTSGAVDEEKKNDVLYRPKQVPEDVDNISEDPRSHPGFDNYGGW